MDEILDARRHKGLIVLEKELIGVIQKYCDDSTLPDGCHTIAVNYDFMRQAFIIKLCHKDFPVVEPGSMVELITIQGEKNNG